MAETKKRHVKGILFADYVRMIRGQKTTDWARHLPAADLAYTTQKIDLAGWYPMSTFERMGNAILSEIAHDDLDAVRMWGRFSVDALRSATPDLVSPGDPVETMMRFRVLRATYFDFDALTLSSVTEDHARIHVHYYMGRVAEEAASFQTLGFFERLLEVADATNVHARFGRRSWAGDGETLLELDWQTTR